MLVVKMRFLFFSLLCPSVGALLCSCDLRYCSSQVCETDGICFLSLKQKNDKVDRVTRCVDKTYLIPPQRPFICEHNQKQTDLYISLCCKDSDFCNSNSSLALSTPTLGGGGGGVSEPVVLVLSCVAVACVVAVLLVLVALVVSKKKGGCACTSYSEVESCETQSTYPVSGPGPSLQDYLSSSASTGSGSGLPLLVQRSVARQISLVRVIGQGRFGEVWQGKWRGESVAVKIFSSIDEKSWFREVEIYQSVMLRHPNVLGFIAADNKDNGTWTQLWLIMEYVENGCLHDYLREHVLNETQIVRMALSIATGLAHLHMDIVGTHGKPSVAHRDLKSKNILVKSNGECAIGDLGLAVRLNCKTHSIDLPEGGKGGTKRYLAPEVLMDTINMNNMDAFKNADMYAFGLVLWEIASRYESTDTYSPPYADLVGVDPTIEQMKKVVCIDGARPEAKWRQTHPLDKYTQIMVECWYENPAARLTALRAKKNLAVLTR